MFLVTDVDSRKENSAYRQVELERFNSKKANRLKKGTRQTLTKGQAAGHEEIAPTGNRTCAVTNCT